MRVVSARAVGCGSFGLVSGDTLETLPRYAAAHAGTCDVLSIDGGHAFTEAYSDLSYARVLASEQHTVVMDDLRCQQWWCKPPSAQMPPLRIPCCSRHHRHLLPHHAAFRPIG